MVSNFNLPIDLSRLQNDRLKLVPLEVCSRPRIHCNQLVNAAHIFRITSKNGQRSTFGTPTLTRTSTTGSHTGLSRMALNT